MIVSKTQSLSLYGLLLFELRLAQLSQEEAIWCRSLIFVLEDLDFLARTIDLIIDEGDNSSTSLDKIEESIRLSVDSIFIDRNVKDDLLFSQTIEAISVALVLNTKERGRAYFDNAIPHDLGCTMEYFYPVLSKLFEKMYKMELDIAAFRLVANVVQCLDDLNDLPDDLANNIATPISRIVNSLKGESSVDICRFLNEWVKKFLERTLDIISMNAECRAINVYTDAILEASAFFALSNQVNYFAGNLFEERDLSSGHPTRIPKILNYSG